MGWARKYASISRAFVIQRQCAIAGFSLLRLALFFRVQVGYAWSGTQTEIHTRFFQFLIVADIEAIDARNLHPPIHALYYKEQHCTKERGANGKADFPVIAETIIRNAKWP